MAYAAHWESADGGEQRVGGERRRLRLEVEGTTAGGHRAEVLVHNISEGGLLIETPTPLDEGEEIVIDLPQAEGTAAVVRWTSGRLCGCEFVSGLRQAALAAAQLRSVPVEAEPGAAPASLGDPGLGARLQRLRKARGLTLAQIAEALNVSKPTVWAWEQGRSRPVESRVGPLAEVLGVPRDELFPDNGFAGPLDSLIARVRQEIASAAGTAVERVRILIEL